MGIFFALIPLRKKIIMKKLFAISLSLLLFISSRAQNSPSSCDTSGTSTLRNNSVFEQWEYRMDKKTKKKTFNTLKEFDENGCVTKLIVPDASEKETYRFNEWEFNENGNLSKYREGKIDADSAKSAAFSEIYNYNYAGLLSGYRKDIYEGELSQTVVKWEYSYSGKGEKTGSSFSKIVVRRDTIRNDDIKYAGNGAPIERTINNYFPKGLSDFSKYNASGLLLEYIRYEKGKMTSHKIYSYQYDKQGTLVEETIIDGIGKTNEKKKHEKDKIIYTLKNSKGKVLKTTNEPFTLPAIITYPLYPVAEKQIIQKQSTSDKTTSKIKSDKKKNKIVEQYLGQKLISTETLNPKGLLIEKNNVEGGFLLKYEYTFY